MLQPKTCQIWVVSVTTFHSFIWQLTKRKIKIVKALQPAYSISQGQPSDLGASSQTKCFSNFSQDISHNISWGLYLHLFLDKGLLLSFYVSLVLNGVEKNALHHLLYLSGDKWENIIALAVRQSDSDHPRCFYPLTALWALWVYRSLKIHLENILLAWPWPTSERAK